MHWRAKHTCSRPKHNPIFSTGVTLTVFYCDKVCVPFETKGWVVRLLKPFYSAIVYWWLFHLKEILAVSVGRSMLFLCSFAVICETEVNTNSYKLLILMKCAIGYVVFIYFTPHLPISTTALPSAMLRVVTFLTPPTVEYFTLTPDCNSHFCNIQWGNPLFTLETPSASQMHQVWPCFKVYSSQFGQPPFKV